MGGESRETFGSRLGFIFAAAGSAIGLGNIFGAFRIWSVSMAVQLSWWSIWPSW